MGDANRSITRMPSSVSVTATVLLCFQSSDTTSGAVLSGAHLARLLNELGYNCICLLPSHNEVCERLLDSMHVSFFVVRSFTWVEPIVGNGAVSILKSFVKWAWNAVYATPCTVRVMKSNRVGIVHINTVSSYVGALAARRLGIPYVYHIREFLEEDHGQRFSFPRMSEKILSGSRQMIAISNGVYDKWTQRYPNVALCRIYNGIDGDRFVNQKREHLFSGDAVRMCIVGKIREGKRQLELLAALALLQMRTERKFLLVVVGECLESTYYDECLKFVREAGLESCVRFIGGVDEPERIYATSDIAFTCSRSEGFGRVTVEAMLSGCVVIASDGGANMEIVEHSVTGYIYESGSSESLASCIADVLENPGQARAIAAHGRASAMERFTAEENASRVASVYQQILEGESAYEGFSRPPSIRPGGGRSS